MLCPMPKEVAQWRQYARMLLIVPVDLEQDLAIIVGIGHFPIQTKRVVNLENWRDIMSLVGVDDSRS